MTSVCIYSEERCACCANPLKVVAIPGATAEGNMSVRCTHCPAGGDVLADGAKTGPAFEGVQGAQKHGISWNTPDRPALTGDPA